MTKKQQSLPLLKCTRCDFSTKNRYIYSRHRNRCCRVDTPGVVKGPATTSAGGTGEKVLNPLSLVPAENPVEEESSFVDTEDSKAVETSAEKAESVAESEGAEASAEQEEIEEVAEEEPEGESIDADNEPEVKQMVSELPAASQTAVGGSKMPKILLRLKTLKAPTKAGKTVKYHRGQSLRNYHCDDCNFKTTKSKAYLYHLLNKHNASFNIFPCTFCDYACRWKHKLLRHMKMVHKNKTLPHSDDIEAEVVRIPPKGQISSAKKVQPPPKPKVGKTVVQKAKALRPKKKACIPTKLNPISKSAVAEYILDLTKSPNSPHFKCKLCLYSSRMRSRVYNHVMSCHIHAKLFQCKYCDFNTTKKTEYYAHNTEHEDQKLWRCEDCAYTTSFKPNFDRHRVNHNRQFRYKCSICSYTSDHEGALKRHFMYNHPENLQKLSMVPFESNSNALSAYPSPSVPVKDLSDDDDAMDEDCELLPLLPGFKRCEFCGFLGMSEEEVAEHVASHKQSSFFPCQICKLRYKRSGDLNRHMKLKHNLRLRDFIRRQGTEFQIEISLEGEITVPSINGSQAKVISKKNLSCDESDMMQGYGLNQDEEDSEIQFRSHSEDQQPLDLSMPSPEKYSFSGEFDPDELHCPDCNYIAKWPSDLRRHSVVHTVEKRFKCTHCSRKYKYSGDLNVHMRRDHKIEPDSTIKADKPSPSPKRKPGVFRCSNCPYTSPFRSEVERHSRCHTDAKPHKCILCDYQSHWKGDVKRHIQKHHPKVLTSTVPLEDFIQTKTDEETPTTSTPAEKTKPTSVPKPSLKDTSPIQIKKTSEKKPETPTVTNDDSKEQIFRCKYCEFTASAPSKLKAHVITHVNLKQWKCPACPRRSNWKWDVRKHILKDHPDCPNKNVIMLSEEEAKATIQDYISKSTMPKRENHLDNMNIAEAQDELRFPYRCSACGYNSAYRWEVSKHLRMTHPGENCSVLVAFSTESTEEETSPQQTTPPKPPSPKMNIRKLLKQPVLQQTLVQTTPPPAVAEQDDSLDKSRKRTRSKKVEENLESKPYMCGECGKRCSTNGDVKKHYNYIHPDIVPKVIYLGDITSPSPTFLPKIRAPPPPTPPPTAITPPQTQSTKGIKKNPLETKYSNPKATGYIKPFQCSACLRRSNWKWDINKHMRESHGDVPDCHLIILPEDEARATLATYIPPTHGLSRASLSKAGSPQKNQSASQVSESPVTSPSPSPIKQQVVRNLKQFKCSGCGYRSDWRSDIQRHIKNKHGMKRAVVIMLDPSQARASLSSYVYNRSAPQKRILFQKPGQPPPRRSSGDSSDLAASKPGEANRPKTPSSVKVRLWKCSKCSFRHKERRLVSIHLKTHSMKPFNCKICGHSSLYRSALYRHLRAKHNSNDFTNCHVTMSYIKESENGQEKVAEEDMTIEELEELEAEKISQLQGEPGEEAIQGQRAFHCKLCDFETAWRSCVRRHIRERHGSSDAALYGIKALDPDAIKKKGRKKYDCPKCPYQTEKQSLLRFHMTNHKPQPGNRYKCKYCPYFVCAKRLLHQHLKIHAKEAGKAAMQELEAKTSITPKRYQCEKCPFKTGSKNDILYHKQFHRPRPSAAFKCDYCDYWVTHRRLLKQHYRVHKAPEADTSPQKVATPVKLKAPLPPSVASSPCKSEVTDASWFYNPVDAASIKQQVISSKITRSLPAVTGLSPAKSTSGPAGYMVKNGVFRKLHHCRYCPYVNLRGRNLRLHEKMHGWRMSEKQLFQCNQCNYMVGSKGLLSHHMKVHSKGYGTDPMDNTTAELENLEGVHLEGDEQSDRSSEISDQQHDSRMDALLEIARFKKYACEKCPYASAKRNHFERHLELHGSRQRYLCDFCDYSVPSNNLLTQHQKLHLMPNQNLLAVQSIINLQHLPEVTADVAVASFLSAYNPEKEKTVSVTHDHMELYENHPDPPEELKKLYRCDRCPYANVRRDHLLAHLKFHMVRSELSCQYCDYSVGKSHLLHQHIKVHFNPLPEFSDWLEESGAKEREAREVTINTNNKDEKGDKTEKDPGKSVDASPMKGETLAQTTAGENKSPSVQKNDEKGAENVANETTYVCQYCDREFSTSEPLVSHEMQHLIGNNFEASEPMDVSSPVTEEALVGGLQAAETSPMENQCA